MRVEVMRDEAPVVHVLDVHSFLRLRPRHHKGNPGKPPWTLPRKRRQQTQRRFVKVLWLKALSRINTRRAFLPPEDAMDPAFAQLLDSSPGAFQFCMERSECNEYCET